MSFDIPPHGRPFPRTEADITAALKRDLDALFATGYRPRPLPPVVYRTPTREENIARNERDDAREAYLIRHGLSRRYSAEDRADYLNDWEGGR